jgi:hypothetical protein
MRNNGKEDLIDIAQKCEIICPAYIHIVSEGVVAYETDLLDILN